MKHLFKKGHGRNFDSLCGELHNYVNRASDTEQNVCVKCRESFDLVILTKLRPNGFLRGLMAK